MGGQLGKHFSREQKVRAEAETEAEAESTQGRESSSSIIELIKPECLKRTKRVKKLKRPLNPPEKNITKVRKLTLEDCLLASPGPSSALEPAECFSGGELYVFKQFSKRVHPSSSARVQLNKAAATTSKPKANFSFDETSSISSVVNATSSSTSKPRGSFFVDKTSSTSSVVDAASSSTSKPRGSFFVDKTSSTSSVVDAASSSMSRSQSEKLKKKVRFKLPEEADIIIFYSPPEPLGSDSQSS